MAGDLNGDYAPAPYAATSNPAAGALDCSRQAVREGRRGRSLRSARRRRAYDRVGDKAAADAERPAACGFVSEPVPKWSFGTCSHRDDLRALGCGSARRSRRRAERESAHQTPRPTRAAPGEGRRSVHYAPTCQLVPGGRPWVAPHGGHVSGGGRPHRCTALLACIEAARSVGSTARGCRQQIPPVKSGWFRRTVGPGSGVNVGTYPVPFRG